MIKKQQKEFAYIDFATEADCQEALKNHEDVSYLCPLDGPS
jgi:RNA recognition motif-containing protein